MTTKNKTYNHAFCFAWSVSGSKYEDWMDCIKHEQIKLIEALYDRVVEQIECRELTQSVEGWDTYEEEN